MANLHVSEATGSDGAEFSTLTPTLGGSAVKLAGVDMLVQSNRLYANGAASDYEIPDPPLAYPYDLVMKVRVVTGIAGETLAVVAQGLTTNVQATLTYGSPSTVSLSGAATASANVTLVAGTDYMLRLELLSDTQARCYLDGVPLFGGIVTLSALGAVDVSRIVHAVQVSSSTTGMHFDLFELSAGHGFSNVFTCYTPAPQGTRRGRPMALPAL